MSAIALSPATAHYREAFERCGPQLRRYRRAPRGGDGALCRTRVSRRARRSLEVHEPAPPRIAALRAGRSRRRRRSTCRAAFVAQRLVLVNGSPAASRSGCAAGGFALGTLATARRRRSCCVLSAGGGTERFAALNAALGHRPAAAVDVRLAQQSDDVLQLTLVTTGTGTDACEPPHRRAHGAGQPRTPADRPRRRRRARAFRQRRARHRTRRRRAPHLVPAAAPGRARFPHRADRGAASASTPRSSCATRSSAPHSRASTSTSAWTVARRGTEITGVFLADGSRHLDTHVHVDHRAIETTQPAGLPRHRRQPGRGVFNGKAIVHEGAQKSNARQSTATCC